MRYMLMMQGTQANFASFTSLPPDDIKAHILFMKRFNQELTEAGEFVLAEGLSFEARVVRADGRGEPVVTDGPFPESKEFLAGFWIVDCDSPERAVELAAKVSAAPGRAGAPLNIPVEVREVMSAPPVEV